MPYKMGGVPDSYGGAVTRTELVQPGPAEALASLLGVSLPDLSGEGLPLLWHWLYLLDRPAQADLGPDGHPIRGTVPTPPEPGLRRMWAGGQVTNLAPLRVGEEATRETSVESAGNKRGRSGRLVFVAVRHRITQRGQLAVDERHDIVYREQPSSPELHAPAGPVVPAGPDEWPVEVTPVLLFRYSALLYNAHRIHYDRDYATQVEGYPGLVTHGPLQALVMAEAARASGSVPAHGVSFDYRLVAPLFDHQGLVARARQEDGEVRTWARDLFGRQTAEGTLTRLR